MHGLFVLAPLLIAIVAVAATQEDCPNAATYCPESCAGEQCARFLNAQCQMNSCHGLCAPNFFWRGRNVTDRCPVERCSDRVCLGLCWCVERVHPETCPGPAGIPQSFCRQYIQARCVLPTNCSQVSCEAGMFCREREGRRGVTCVRARKCYQLACGAGFLCSLMEKGSRCVKSVTLSCEDLTCPGGTVCVTDSIPSRNLSAAQCLNREEAERLPTFDTFFCGSGATICDEMEACVDIFDSGVYFVPGCMVIDCDLESPTICREGRVCANVSTHIDAKFRTSCIDFFAGKS